MTVVITTLIIFILQKHEGPKGKKECSNFGGNHSQEKVGLDNDRQTGWNKDKWAEINIVMNVYQQMST